MIVSARRIPSVESCWDVIHPAPNCVTGVTCWPTLDVPSPSGTYYRSCPRKTSRSTSQFHTTVSSSLRGPVQTLATNTSMTDGIVNCTVNSHTVWLCQSCRILSTLCRPSEWLEGFGVNGCLLWQASFRTFQFHIRYILRFTAKLGRLELRSAKHNRRCIKIN